MEVSFLSEDPHNLEYSKSITTMLGYMGFGLHEKSTSWSGLTPLPQLNGKALHSIKRTEVKLILEV